MLDPFDEIMLKNYFSLSSTIKELQQYKRYIRQEFYTQNMATRTTYQKITRKSNEMIVQGFRPDREIEKLLLNQERIDCRIQRCIFRKKHFSYFLESLTIAERYSLEERFKDEKDTVCSQNLIERILDEINEIEIAICYREGIEVFDLEKRETYEDADINLGRMCDFFEL